MITSDEPNEPREILSEEYDTVDPEPLTTLIVRLVATVEDRDAMHLIPLGSVVDPDALERIFESRSMESREETIEVAFQYEGYLIEIDSDGAVRILVEDE